MLHKNYMKIIGHENIRQFIKSEYLQILLELEEIELVYVHESSLNIRKIKI